MNATQYNRLNELLSDFSSASTALERAEANIKTVQLEAAKTLLPEFAQLKIAVADLEEKLKCQCEEHYQALFPEDKRTHNTPFGAVKYHKSTSLEYEDEEKVVLKIQLVCAKEAKQAKPRFAEDQILRTLQEPNLEALTTLDDAVLALFGIVRVTKDNFKATPFAMKTDKPARAKKMEN
jgi:hypothetical protein